LSKYIKKTITATLSFITVIFMFVPENQFSYQVIPQISLESNIIIVRIMFFGAAYVLIALGYGVYLMCRRKVTIKGKNYSITVEYGDIFKIKKAKKVIPFDECFTTEIGNEPYQINKDSVCGQYLLKNTSLNIQNLIDGSNLTKKGKSQYCSKDRYESGRILNNGEYLLMAFAKLDKNGLGRMTRKEYTESLEILWEEIDKYYGQDDVCVPILGSGVTRINDMPLTQQELLDIVIDSYRLSVKKIHNPAKLRIICKRREDFSLNRIGENI